MASENDLRDLIDGRKKAFIEEIQQLPKSKREFYLNLTDRALKEIIIEKNLGKLEL